MKILVGYDGSNAAMDALKLAVRHAKAFEGRVVVVTSLKGKEHEGVKEIQQAETQLAYAQSYLDRKEVEGETHLLIRGLEPGEDIVQFAREKKIDEIVIGVKRRSKVGKLIFGSNAQHVILSAPCPVVTIQ
ncbi:MAG: universal stress protein [Desulfobacterales bacterium]|jgi:nucleotide-binding universal stress UspA family protein